MDESAIPPLLCAIGHPIAGNPIQFAMEQVLQAEGLDWRFLSFDVSPERLDQAIRGIDSLGFRGVSIAPPHTARAFELVEQHTEAAREARWVDGLSRTPAGAFLGHNLAGDCFVDLLGRPGLERATVALLGDCGECVALSATLLGCGVSALLVRDVDPSRFHSPTPRHSDLTHSASLGNVTVLIRGRHVQGGAAAEFSESQIGRLPPECVVVDLAVCAGTSPLLRFSAERGLRVISLIDLLVARTARAFQLWTGRAADTERLREAFEEYLEI